MLPSMKAMVYRPAVLPVTLLEGGGLTFRWVSIDRSNVGGD